LLGVGGGVVGFFFWLGCVGCGGFGWGFFLGFVFLGGAGLSLGDRPACFHVISNDAAALRPFSMCVMIELSLYFLSLSRVRCGD